MGDLQFPIYLDNNATTPVDPRVVDVMLPVLQTHFGNPASSTHSYGWYAEELVQIAREHVAALIGAEPDEIIFTSGATESNNLALRGIAAALSSRNRASHHIVSATTEHSSVLEPLRELERTDWFKVTFLDVDRDGRLPPDSLKQALRQESGLVSIMLGNNEIGVIHDLEKIVSLARAQDVVVHTDATQAVGKIPVDVKLLNVDLLSLSAHKLYGPKGIGALFVKRHGPGARIRPLAFGGGHEFGLRAGTLNVPGIVGFGEACRIAREEFAATHQHISNLTVVLLEQLRVGIPDMMMNGSVEHRLPGNVNIAISGVESAALIGAVNSKIAISSTSACKSKSRIPSYVLQALGVDQATQLSSIRLGVGKFNTAEEIAIAAETLSEAVRTLRG